ncbi:MAG TPA: hypothetical protein VGE39_13525 [Prosthecobacter sp.]
MPLEYHTPGKEELLNAIRHEFQFLVTEYGFVELQRRPERYLNPYSVLYRKAPVDLCVEGISYGFGVCIEFRVREEGCQEPLERFSLHWVVQIRRAPPELTFPDKRGQLTQIPKLAHELRSFADDLLRGDLSILPAVKNAIHQAQLKGDQHEAMDKFLRAEARSQEAFRAKNYASVVLLLGPCRDLLNPSSRKRLEIAQHRLTW